MMVLVAAASAQYALPNGGLLGYNGLAGLGYNGLAAAPLGYSGLPLGMAGAPLGYSGLPLNYAAAPAPVAIPAARIGAYSAPVYSHSYVEAAPAIHTRTGVRVENVYEPVEQHGYQIAY